MFQPRELRHARCAVRFADARDAQLMSDGPAARQGAAARAYWVVTRAWVRACLLPQGGA